MKRTYTNRSYLDAIQNKIMVFDGAMGTNLQRQNLTAEHFGGEKTMGCNDYLVISYPQAVENVHRSFLEAGVDVVETCTFRSNRLTLGEYGLGDRVREINMAAARLARKCADDFSVPHSVHRREGANRAIRLDDELDHSPSGPTVRRLQPMQSLLPHAPGIDEFGGGHPGHHGLGG